MNVLVTVTRDNVKLADTSPIQEFIESLSCDARSLKAMIGRLEVSVSGYDNDPRPLWEIPEVRRYFARFHNDVPYMLLFLSPEKQASKLWLLLCCELSYQNGVAAIEAKTAGDFVAGSFGAINAFCERKGIDPACRELIDLSCRLTNALSSS